jgi:hypothetical protein
MFVGWALFRIPLFTDSTLTQSRKHWSVLKKRVDQTRLIVDSQVQKHRSALLAIGVTHVRITRIAPKKLDIVNLLGSQKATQDAIADVLGRDDADWKPGAIKWEFEQRSEAPRTYGVEVRLWNANEWQPPTTTPA